MKQKKNYIKNEFLLFIYIFFLLFLTINAVDNCINYCKIVDKKCYNIYDHLPYCDIFCMPDLVTDKCYNCSGIHSAQYYQIENGKCEINKCNGKVVFGTRQCVKDCGKLSDVSYTPVSDTSDDIILYGIEGTDYCYTKVDCSQGNKKIENNQCDCQFLFSLIKDKDNKIYKHCYGNGENCSPEDTQFNSDTRECGSCPLGSKKKIIQRSGQSDITRCSEKCDYNEVIDEDYCLAGCPVNQYKYYDENGESHCTDNCKDFNLSYILEGNICNETCNYYLYRYENNSCLGYCKKPYYRSYRYYGHVCSLACDKGHKFYNSDESDNLCKRDCPARRYKNNMVCTDNDANCYIRIDDEGTTKRCYSSCEESGYPYYNTTDPNLCRRDCSEDYNNTDLYHIEGEFKCLEECPTNDYYYEKDQICYCYLYGINDQTGEKICYKDEEDCRTSGGFSYRKGSECLKKCNPYFEVVDDVSTTAYLKKCFNSAAECKSNYYYYYNTNMLKCWSTCPSNMFSTIVDSEGKPIEDLSGSTCITECGKNFPKHTYGTNVCKEKCDDGEFYTLEEPNVCISKCNNTYPYIGEKNECLKVCENKKYYFTMVSGKYKCVSDCKDYDKFYIKDDPKCYDNCPTSQGFYYYNSYHQCLKSCIYDASEPYYYPQTTYPQPCISTNENKYYYENKTIVSSCSPNYISARGSFLCVESCGSKKIYENYCVSNCPSEAPYIQKNGNIVKCVNSCGSNYVILFKDECISACPSGYSANTTYKICYPNCKFGEKFNIDLGKCETTCPTGNSYYEYTNIFGSTYIYVCRKSCMGTNKFVKDGNDKECVSKCPENNNFITFNSNVCISKCGSTQYFKDTETSGITYKINQCLDSCPTDQGYFYVKDNGVIKKKCYKECPAGFNFIVDNTQDKFICISACPSSHPFYLERSKGTKSYYTCLEYNPCSGNDNYYYNGKCLTGAGCKNNKFLFVENKACVTECSSSNQFKTVTGQITLCQNYCGSQYFIDSEKNCLGECPKNENFVNYINGDKICKTQCDNNKYYYILTKKTDYNIYNCTEFCQNDVSGYYLTVIDSKECVKTCTSPLIISKNERKCYYYCLSSPNYKFTLTAPARECSSTCNTNYKYYYENEKICLAKCSNNDFAYVSTDNDYIYECIKNCGLLSGNYYTYTNSSTGQNKFCVKQCPSDQQYLYNNTCIKHCPTGNKFFIKEFKHSETDLQKKCLTDCPADYPYYKVYKENNERTYGCINNCDEGYKVINFTDKSISAILCINDCPDKLSEYNTDYKDYIFKIVEKNNKTCYSFCPPEKPYYKYDHSEDNNCYKECPEETPFTEMNKFECKSEDECDGSFIDYENKKCLSRSQEKCPANKKYMSRYVINTKVKYICLDNCIEKYGKYLSPYDTCVNNCETDYLVSGEGLTYDPKNDKCICKHLYIINETLQMQCLKNSTSEMKCKNVSSIYHIKMFNSKECVKVCNNSNILSVSEDICYNSSHQCGVSDLPNDRNTHLITKANGQRKCACSYKFYNKTDEEYRNTQYPNLTICLDYDSLCPSGYGRFVPETKECLKTEENCPAKFSCLFLDIFCLRDCPKNSTINTTGNYYQCIQPNEYWHETDPGSGNYECIDKCLDKYPVYAPATNQCLYECTESYYPYVYERKCYNSCNNSKILNIENGFITEITDTNSEDFKYGRYTCDCHNPWFYNDVHKKICSDSMIEYSITDCNNFTNPNPVPIYDHLVRRTLQCIDKCPKNLIILLIKNVLKIVQKQLFIIIML